MNHCKRNGKQRGGSRLVAFLICCSLTFGLLQGHIVSAYAAEQNEVKVSKKTLKKVNMQVTITEQTIPCDDSVYLKTYNVYTSQYYTILSYLKRLEAAGGGTLIFEKGTYTITNTLYVPSNVTIIFKDGVVIRKETKTGTHKLSASKSIFQLASPSMAKVEGAYSKYNGVHDVSFIGEGTVIIDMNYDYGALGIMMGHNKNVTIKGITFQNMYSGHFIEMDASKNVIVEDCVFQNHKDSPNNNKEAINLDTPDITTNGFHATWTSYDKTPNKNVLIQNCVFRDLERAIGTHKYSEGKLHKDVQIINNKIYRCDKDAIRVMNWENATIKGNVIDTVTDGTDKAYRAILVSGIQHMELTENMFYNVARPVQIFPWKNSGPGSQYDIIYDTLSSKEIELLKNNVLIGGEENFIRWNKTYDVFDQDTVKIYLNGKKQKAATVVKVSEETVQEEPTEIVYRKIDKYKK